MDRNEFLVYCRKLAGDKVIDRIIWRYEGVWGDVGPKCRDAAIDGVGYRYEEVTKSSRTPGSPSAAWTDETERSRWFRGPQPRTAAKEKSIALAKILPLKEYQYRVHPSLRVCDVCGQDTSYYMDADVNIPICPSCHVMYYRGASW
jgi:hypothetical protein